MNILSQEKEKEIIKKKELQKANGLPPDPIDEDDLLRIAKHFEKKYVSILKIIKNFLN